MLYGGAAVVGVGLLLLLAKSKAPTVGGVASGLASGAVEAVNGAFVGGVKSIGEVFGIPDTNASRCEQDIAAGRTWDASFSCPAGRFVGSVWNSTTIRADEVNDARQIDRIMEREAAGRQDLSGLYFPDTGEQYGYYDAMGNRIY